jgi:hypothetical protein
MAQSRSPDLLTCFRFPLAGPAARRDVLIGGTLLFGPGIGWIFNLGHRLEVVYRLAHDDTPLFRGFRPWGKTFLRGLQACSAILTYLSPAMALGLASFWTWRSESTSWPLYAVLALILGILAVYVLPGGMTHNAAYRDMSLLYRPDKALRVAISGGRHYLKAWGIALVAICLSILGLPFFGIGFFYTSVWAWSVVGYAFSVALLDLAPKAARAEPAIG